MSEESLFVINFVHYKNKRILCQRNEDSYLTCMISLEPESFRVIRTSWYWPNPKCLSRKINSWRSNPKSNTTRKWPRYYKEQNCKQIVNPLWTTIHGKKISKIFEQIIILSWWIHAKCTIHGRIIHTYYAVQLTQTIFFHFFSRQTSQDSLPCA
jgi:hypothetical protein